ncbi:hypothetical protein BOTBODRAFT_39380 [Botryobasidium botryosum FD-172 SS1]|uniref:Transmembrane protein n=1 Tax=Botryobasidium botryosum (strain FD-172 SS1) TaxID=930990 RepID=A0A067LUC5_BOTB1|nr:hypothetical protein BOTBODRAFT_39380 [Botryobasidium botryosum FD-172 SS1]
MLGNILSALIAAASCSLLVKAQGITNATCLPAYSWMDNSLGQNACLVAAYISSGCTTGTWTVPALTSLTSSYNPPNGTGVTDCRCSTVEYQLISACVVCQGGTNPAPWLNWATNCPANLISVGTYPHPIPAGTSVPAWAFLDPTVKNTFDVTAALAAANLPETPGGATSSGATTHPFNGPTLTPVAPFPSSVSTPASTGSSSTDHTGAIVGGVVGGVLGLALLCALIFLFMRRSHRTAPAPAPAPDMGMYKPQMPMGSPQQMGSPQMAAYPSPGQNMNYPGSPGSAYLGSAYPHQQYSPPPHVGNPQMPQAYPAPSTRPGGYSGAGEVGY